MVVLKKIKSATLIEALIATVLIVVIFMIASMVINNLLLNNFSKNTRQVENRLNELTYQLEHKRIRLPYHESFQDWEIDLKRESMQGIDGVAITASGKSKTVIKKQIDVQE